MILNLQSKKNNNGFTMIELLIVIVIMGILSVVGLGTFRSSQLKARDSKRKTDIRSIGDALEVYYNDFGSYPVGQTGNIIGCGADAISACSPGSIWQNTTNSTTYMVQIPEDPNSGLYYYISDGRSFQIYAHLENERDRDVPKDLNGDPTNYSNPGNNGCVTGDCNYGKSSTNIDLDSPI
jgi:prepilin-type N-terminal cleavage/methylation domain-containing protein